MRKLALFTLGIYTSVMMSSLVFASSPVEIDKLCSGGTTLNTDVAKQLDDETLESDVKETIKGYYSSYNMDLANNPGTCGELNTTTNSYEMGDCASASPPQLVTEILEPVGAAGKTSDGQIIDLYKGVCCIVGGTTSDAADAPYYCDQSRNVYLDTYATCMDGANSCQKVQWLIASTGAGILKTYVRQIYVFGAGIVGFIAVATIVGSGIQISVSGATGDITAAKDRITQSIMGIALLFFSALILYTINPTFFY